MLLYFVIALCTIAPALHAMDEFVVGMDGDRKVTQCDLDIASTFRAHCDYQNLAGVKELKELGKLNVNCIYQPLDNDSKGYCTSKPLHIALDTGAGEIARYLIENGASTDVSSDPELLTKAINISGILATILIRSRNDTGGYRIPKEHRHHALIKAIKDDKKSSIVLLAVGEELPFPLVQQAASCATSSALEILIRNASFSVTSHDSEKETLLFSALGNKYAPDIITLLIQCGTPINHQNKKGETALFRAVQMELPDAACCLLNLGADPLIATKNGLTPSDIAARLKPSPERTCIIDFLNLRIEFLQLSHENTALKQALADIESTLAALQTSKPHIRH